MELPPIPGGQNPVTSGISNIQLNTPYIGFHEEISYEYENSIVVMPVKVAGAAPVIQQTANPTLRVIQAGYSKQVAKNSLSLRPANPPAYSSDDYTIERGFFSPANAEPIADGSVNMYTTSWRYVMIKNAALGAQDDVPAMIPFDPRRPNTNSEKIPSGSIPDVAVIPSDDGSQ